MKSSPILRGASCWLCIALAISHPPVAWGTVQTAWAAHYSSGLPGATNQVVKIVMDPQGNLVIAGSATGAAHDYDYLTLKYAPDGRLLWSARYASVSNLDDQVRAMAVDADGNVVLTGTSVTVKYAGNGTLQWTAPFAGRDVAVGADEFIYVTGFSGGDFVAGITSADFATVKLAPQGSNVWIRMTDVFGNSWWDRSDRIAVDQAGNVYVAGATVWGCTFDTPPRPPICYQKYGLVKYDSTGTRLWTTTLPSDAGSRYIYEVVALAATQGRVYFCGRGSTGTFYTGQLGSIGLPDWTQAFNYALAEGASAMAVNEQKAVYVTGGDLIDRYSHTVYTTFKADSQGTYVWQATYNAGVLGTHRANAMALDSAGNIYVTGRSESAAGDADWATIKYNPDGQEQWVRRYDGPAHGLDEGRAIAVDAAGAIYVAGTQTTTNGAIETVLIKYVDLTSIELLANGTAVLRFLGSPGQPTRLQASTNLSQWSEVLSGVIGNDGVARFEDTNAPAYPTRFYRSVSP